MKQVTGDLIELALLGEFDVIVHGCNCFHTMGAGIAKIISVRFPEALVADKETEHGSKNKLGTISFAEVTRGTKQLIIVNAYTQFHWKGTGRKVDYDAIRLCFGQISKIYGDRTIGYPMIGAGLAGGDWSVISDIIRQELKGSDHKLVVLPGS